MTGAGLPAELASGRAELHLLTDEDLARALRGAHHLVERLYGERFRRATAAEIREASNAHSSKGRPAPAPALRPWITAECIARPESRPRIACKAFAESSRYPSTTRSGA